MVSPRISFLISKLPHSVGNPCVKKSIDSWLKNVVLPDPDAPVTSVSSPLRRPPRVLLKKLKYWDF